MTKSDKKLGIAAADEGMILTQKLIDHAENEYESLMARKLFMDFYSVKMMYRNLDHHE